LLGAEFFRQRPNFLVDLVEKFGQELATLIISQKRKHNKRVRDIAITSQNYGELIIFAALK
jgi:hypothetical protein